MRILHHQAEREKGAASSCTIKLKRIMTAKGRTGSHMLFGDVVGVCGKRAIAADLQQTLLELHKLLKQ